MAILINNLQDKVEVTEETNKTLEKIGLTVLLGEGISKECEVGVTLVDNDYIKSLNSEYRQVDSPTDVLSFAMEEGEDMLDMGEEIILGDIVISLERALEQASSYGHSVDREVGYLMAHGILHLLGYDHMQDDEKKIMRQKEEAYLASLDLKR